MLRGHRYAQLVANRLARETSPYLLQHKDNPVDWFPWGDEALARARELDRPLLVSIGYAACHWCHVMERESFEDEQIAALMNGSFVPIKVDREERPDVDAICMEACQAINGHGGWPLNVFLTPEQTPFFAGTYFPPDQRPGAPSWRMVIQAVSEAWMHRRDQVREQGARLAASIAAAATAAPARETQGDRVSTSLIAGSVQALAQTFDARHAGWGGAPKFPPHCTLEFLLAAGEPEMALATLRAMANGGIYDQVGGGFARYAVDATWTVPHFEKMLYDNALLARAYLHAWQATGEERFLEVCLTTLRWVLREMKGPEGGFYSALDADSEGVEGRYYVWRRDELEAELGEDAAAAIAWLGVSEEGNFEDPHHPEPGLNVLTARGPEPPEEQRLRIRSRLLEIRDARVAPALDSKRLTSWNALTIVALAEAGAALASLPGDYPDASETPAETGAELLAAAVGCAEFIQRELRDEHGRLLRTYNESQAKIEGFLEDHAYLLEAAVVLFETTCEERWFELAVELADDTIERFADRDNGGFYSTAAGQQLIVRRKDLEDSPIPAGASSAAAGLLRLAQLTGDERYESHGASVLALLAEIAPRHPAAFGHLLQAMHWRLAPARPIACAVPPLPS
jgi:uncharacterized protein